MRDQFFRCNLERLPLPDMLRRYTLPLLAAVFLLQGCTQAPVRVEAGDPRLIWEQRRHELEKIDGWRLKARIGIVAENDSGSASLFWEQQDDRYSLKIIGPFGRGSLLVEGALGEVTMRTGEGEIYTAQSAEELIWQHTGWYIPVSDLQHWVLGLPAQTQAREDYQLDDRGRISRLESGQWTVEYQGYRLAGNEGGAELPDKLRLENSRLSIKLAVREWTLL